MRLFGPLHPLVHFPFQNMDHLPYCYWRNIGLAIEWECWEIETGWKMTSNTWKVFSILKVGYKRKVCKWKSIYSFCWHFRRFLTIEIISFSYELFFGSWRCMLGNFRPLRGNWSEYLWRVQSLSIKTHFRRLLGGGTLGSLAALFCSSRDLIAAASMELLPMFPLDLMRSSFSWFSLNVRASLTE